MSKNIITILSLTLLLTGCAAMQAQKDKLAEYEACDQYKKFVAGADCTKRIAETDTVLLPRDADMQELVDLKEVLAERVRAKKITEAEARLEFTKRKSELAKQKAQEKAARSAAIRNSMHRQRTTCTGFGNQIDCDTY